MENNVYTVVEAAQLLKVSPQTIKRHIRDGSIKAFRLLDNPKAGYRIPVEEIKKLMECL